MSSTFYMPNEYAQEERRPRTVARCVDPKLLLEIFDQPHEALAGAILLSGASDPGFRRSKLYKVICAGLDLDPDRWREILREAPGPK